MNRDDEFDAPELGIRDLGTAEIYAQGAAFYVVLVKNRRINESTEFAEWFLDTFDLDLES